MSEPVPGRAGLSCKSKSGGASGCRLPESTQRGFRFLNVFILFWIFATPDHGD